VVQSSVNIDIPFAKDRRLDSLDAGDVKADRCHGDHTLKEIGLMENEDCIPAACHRPHDLLCSVEMRRLNRFMAEHHMPCFAKEYAIDFNPPGGEDMPQYRYVYIIRESTVGVSIKVRCDCGFEEDLSHYEHD